MAAGRSSARTAARRADENAVSFHAVYLEEKLLGSVDTAERDALPGGIRAARIAVGGRSVPHGDGGPSAEVDLRSYLRWLTEAMAKTR
jgi:hypothetical protein